jgi:hypothetical protein
VELPASPRVVDLYWGTIDTDSGRFKDAKLWPGGGREWDWNETGTSHRPGIQPADVEELLEHGASVVVLGRGQHERLGVTSDTLERLRDAGVEAIVLETREAVVRYNELARAGQAVGALLHSTC